MLRHTLISLDSLTGLNDRERRQEQYLRRLQSLTLTEAQFFFKVFNHTAMRRTIDAQASGWIRQGYGQERVDSLIRHYAGWFETWLQARSEDNTTQLYQAFDVLEDMNIAAIAFRHRCCLAHARQYNRRLKEVKQQFYSGSNN